MGMTLGFSSYWLFTVSAGRDARGRFEKGMMRVYKNGRKIVEKSIPKPFDASDRQRTKFLIGTSWWKQMHNHQHGNFRGKIEDIKIWNRAVDWPATGWEAA